MTVLLHTWRTEVPWTHSK